MMERREHRDGSSGEPDRGDTREVPAEAPDRARRLRETRPPAEGIDVADVHRELIVRYPKISAGLAE
ncbi:MULTISPECIES: hypothetical protein [Methylobacterium]|uniref:hypothetical protein n=1 Tax=Methylobacterium TaxID=407 RepID=UPI0013EAEDFA|nr:hypothetical protein [Methylobacterium sp. DB0501]NGM34746.1 hypothetical protein [Methylobacterium sp. DB0501]